MGLVVGLGLAATGCEPGERGAALAPPPAVARPNILVITVDTLRPDRLSCYGYEGQETPNIDRLAAQGAIFEQATCDVTWTTPSMASVMTGRYATAHGYRSTNLQRLSPENVTLAEILKEAGYTTAAVVGSYPLDSVFGLDQGFEHYDDEFSIPMLAGTDRPLAHVPSRLTDSAKENRLHQFHKSVNDSRRPDGAVTDAAIAWLREPHQAPFFLWVHYFGPHTKPDLRITDPALVRRLQLDRYDPDVLENDREVGRLLEFVDRSGRFGEPLVIFHADHGESLSEHGYLGHGGNLYEPTLRIPLIVRYPPRIPPGTRVAALVRNVDIFPTVVEAVGLKPDPSLSGRSLFSLIADGSGDAAPPTGEPRETYMETFFPAHEAWGRKVRLADGSPDKVGIAYRGVRNGRWKFIRTEPVPIFGDEGLPDVPKAVLDGFVEEKLFDLRNDPGESRNVIEQFPRVANSLRDHLASYMAEESTAIPAAENELDEGARERLRNLGYLE